MVIYHKAGTEESPKDTRIMALFVSGTMNVLTGPELVIREIDWRPGFWSGPNDNAGLLKPFEVSKSHRIPLSQSTVNLISDHGGEF